MKKIAIRLLLLASLCGLYAEASTMLRPTPRSTCGACSCDPGQCCSSQGKKACSCTFC